MVRHAVRRVTVAFGLLCGSFFGINMNTWFPSVKFLDFQGQFFSIALVIGVVQILFGMLLNIWMTVRCFGFGRALGLLGWFIILVSCCLAMGLPMAGLAIRALRPDRWPSMRRWASAAC